MKFIDNLKTAMNLVFKSSFVIAFLLVGAPTNAQDTFPIAPIWCDALDFGGRLQGYVGLTGVTVNSGAIVRVRDLVDSQLTTYPLLMNPGAHNFLQYNPDIPETRLIWTEDLEIPAPNVTPLSFTRLTGNTNNRTFTSTTVPPSDYNTLTINGGATFSGGTYYINTLNLAENNNTYTFNSGNYYIGDFNLRNGARIIINGQVNFHIGRSFGNQSNPNNNAVINPGGTPRDLRVYLYNNTPSGAETIVRFKNNAALTGVVYSQNANTLVDIQNGSVFEGGIVVEGRINVQQNAVVIINDDPFGFSDGSSLCIDHLRISNPPQTLSCLAAPVTLTACGNTACSTTYQRPFDIVQNSTLATSYWRSGTLQDPLTIRMNGTVTNGLLNLSLVNVPGGVTSIVSSHYAQTGNINSLTVTSGSRLRCVDASGLPQNCSVNFVESGLVFSGSNSDPAVPISPKRAGSTYDSYLWALQTNVEEGGTAATCAPLFTDQPQQTVNFRLACTDPNSCTGTPYVIQSGSLPAINVHSAGYTAGQVTFNNQGFAPLSNRFNDVGRVRIDAFLQLEGTTGTIPDPSDDRLAIKTSAEGAANILVYPAALAIVLSETVNSPDPFKAAGESFNLSIVSLYEPLPTELTTPLPITQNFGNESALTWSGSTLASGPLTVGVDLVAPSDGVLGTFGGEWSSNTGGSINYNNVYYHEAGVIRAIPQLAGHSYLGYNIGESGYTQYPLELGTFYPASLSIVNGNFSNAHSCGVFTYMDHDALDFSFEIEALAALRPGETVPSRTVNYTAGFPDLANIGLVAAETLSGASVPDNLIARFEEFDAGLDEWVVIDAIRSDWVDGVLQFSMPADEYLRFARQASYAPDGPYRDVRVGLYVESSTYSETIDTAGAEFDVDVAGATVSAVRIGTVDDIQDIFYGRLALENVFGPEDEDLPVIMRAEYYNGSRFILNTLDSCTPYDYNLLSLVPDAPFPAKGGEVAGELIDGWLPHSHMRWLALGSAGTVEFEYDAPAWLKYIWEQGATEPTNPTAIGEFGRYRSYDRILFRRQQ
ncbi:DUF6701 domain-containing protein [Aliidiomarina haloalkalitolerans]|uniref:DUF6701 domain-containing protein n=1 Tax=Aliidiomarina haloalkalitolerans TaxID=859059 RepID=A0A432VSQ8_9GAMM|nr:DUF6701 domain-containing protein [Aliidiomarina haloalkalitolerans]RUO19426.1 hypothetical protein CWE06_07785 [Aliidiomarina haloalkalitolerans]